MPIGRAQAALGQVFYQRCFYLFIGLLALAVAALVLEPSPRTRIIVNAINLLLDVAVVAAVGRSSWSFIIASLLALPAAFFQLRAIIADDSSHLLMAWSFNAALYAATIAYLLRYVFQRDVMTADKLWGAAAGYLMLGALWAFGYTIVDRLRPGSFSIGGTVAEPAFADLLYFSFTVLTSTGFGDMAPLLKLARALCVLEQLTGSLFLAILIARLAGVYPPPREAQTPQPRFAVPQRRR